MAWKTRASSNKGLIAGLVNYKIIKSNEVMEAMLAVDRANYCTDRSGAYWDNPLDIGWNATISAPHMHAYALEAMKGHLKSGSNVLDVGSGSGYLTAVMAYMTKPDGKVTGVELIPELVRFSVYNIEKKDGDLLNSGRLSIVQSDGHWGYEEQAPYDCIHVGAAPEEIPEMLIKQLKPGGRMILPVGPEFSQKFVQVDKQSDGSLKEETLLHVRYVPLVKSSMADFGKTDLSSLKMLDLTLPVNPGRALAKSLAEKYSTIPASYINYYPKFEIVPKRSVKHDVVRSVKRSGMSLLKTLLLKGR